jgi:hypothetical protein
MTHHFILASNNAAGSGRGNIELLLMSVTGFVISERKPAYVAFIVY